MRNTLSFGTNHTPTEINDSSLFGGVTFQQETNIGSDFQYGAVAAASVKFTVDNSDNLASSWMGHTFQWYCQMSNEDAPVSKGFFTIRDIEKNGRKATITAYDLIYDLNEIADVWVSTLTYPITLKQMVSSMAAKTGISIMALTDAYRGNYTVYNNFMTSNITYREILEYIAQVCNVFFYADSATKQIKYKRYTPTNTIIDNTKYVSLNISDYEIEPVDKVQIQSTFDDIGYIAGTGTNVYIITENPLFFTSDKQTYIQEIAANILSELSTITYTPMTFSTLADFGIQCGDIIKVNGKTCYIMKKSIKPSGCEFECVGNKRRDTQKTEVNSAITALNNKTNELIRTVDETKSTLTEVKGSLKTVTDEQGNITEQIATLTTNVSEVQQTANGLTSTVSSVQTTLNNLDGEVETLKTKQSTIEQNVNSITTKVESVEGTADEAKTMASEAKQTANSFSTKITEVENTANGAATTASEAKQTANSFSTRITTAEGNISSISQTASKIDWVIKSGTSSSNFTITDRMATLTAEKIDLSGYVTINSLKAGGTTTIDGGRITTGTISADRVDLTSLKVRNVYNANDKMIITSASSYMYIGGDSSAKNVDYIWFRTGSILFSSIGSSVMTIDVAKKQIYTDGTWKLGISSSQGFDVAYIDKIYMGGGGGYISMDANKNFLVNGVKITTGTSTAGVNELKDGTNTVTLSGTTLKPLTSSYSLGGSSNYWGTAYITKLYLSSTCYITAGSASTIKVGTTTIGGSSSSDSYTTITPSKNGSYDLGSSSYYWNNVYAYALWLKSGYNTVKLTCYASNELAINGKKATHA